jgi:hypothetical protein
LSDKTGFRNFQLHKVWKHQTITIVTENLSLTCCRSQSLPPSTCLLQLESWGYTEESLEKPFIKKSRYRG